jgi:hypothetical protein
MRESVAELLSKLQFVGGRVETLYLNATRVREEFIGHRGAIESFTRTASKELSGKTPVVELGGQLTSEGSVTYSLDEPITQALVLRASLKSAGSLFGLAEAKPGSFVSHTGTAIISRPTLFDDLQREALAGHPGLYDRLETERAERDKIIAITHPPGRAHWLLTVIQDAMVSAAVLDNSWLSLVWPDWIGRGERHEVFGICRESRGLGVPLLATCHLGVHWD